MALLDKEFITNQYPALLGNLRDNGYLSQKDVETLLFDSVKHGSIYLSNVKHEKAEIIRKAIRENYRKFFR